MMAFGWLIRYQLIYIKYHTVFLHHVCTQVGTKRIICVTIFFSFSNLKESLVPKRFYRKSKHNANEGSTSFWKIFRSLTIPVEASNSKPINSRNSTEFHGKNPNDTPQTLNIIKHL